MARIKKDPNETAADRAIRLRLEKIANHSPRSEKTSWNRKRNNMDVLLEAIHPVEEQISDLEVKRQAIFDQISAIRLEMVDTCVHPYNQLVIQDHIIICKFCERKLTVVYNNV